MNNNLELIYFTWPSFSKTQLPLHSKWYIINNLELNRALTVHKMKIKLVLLSRGAKRYHLLLIASKILRISRIHKWNKLKQRIESFFSLKKKKQNCFLNCSMYQGKNLNLSFERHDFSVSSYSWLCLFIPFNEENCNWNIARTGKDMR